MLETSDLISSRELAEQLDVHVKTLQRWVRLGEGPKPMRMGGRLIFSRQAISDWLESLENETA